MSSSNFEVKRRRNGHFGVYITGTDTYIGALQRKEHAERLCAMMNDTAAIPTEHNTTNTSADNIRMAQTQKLFLLQEGLTWKDLDLDDDCIRTINRFLEMPLDLRQAK